MWDKWGGGRREEQRKGVGGTSERGSRGAFFIVSKPGPPLEAQPFMHKLGKSREKPSEWSWRREDTAAGMERRNAYKSEARGMRDA